MAPKAPTLPSAEEIGKLVPIRRIAKETPYSQDFLRQLARSGKIRAFKLNRDWLTTPDAIRDYLKTQTKRHEKALGLLQAAEKAFMALTLLLIVFSATPQARADGLANPPPRTMSAILHKLTDRFFGKFSGGSTTISYRHEIAAKHPIETRGPEAPETTLPTTPHVLGDSTQVTTSGSLAEHSSTSNDRATAPILASTPNQSASAPITTLLHSLTASWLNFGRFYGQQISIVFGINNSALALQARQIKTALLSLGQALLGKTTEEYLADVPARIFALAKHPIEPRGPEISPELGQLPQVTGPKVLGIRTSTPKGSVTNATSNSAFTKGGLGRGNLFPSQDGEVWGVAINQVSLAELQTLITQTFQFMLAQGLLNGPKGDKGDSGLTPGFSGPNGIVQNGNGQTTAVIGGNAMVSYIPASSNGNFAGASLSGFTDLSAQNLTASQATLTGNLTGTAATFSGALTVSGKTTLATSTLSTLTVSGPATFSGSTTIAGLTVTSLNPALTQGSVAFQGASGLSQDNTNFFYDSTNHRLGLGTTTPTQLLTVAGNTLVTGNATTSGSQIVSGAFGVSGASTLATTTATNFTASGPATLQSTLAVIGTSTLATTTATNFTDSGLATFQNTLAVAGTSTLATSTITNLTVSQAPTISVFTTGLIHSNSSGLLSSSAVNLSTGDVTGVLPAGNGGLGTTTLGSLTVGSNLSITGGQAVLIGTSTQVSLGSNVVTGTSNDTNVTGSIAANTLTLGWTGTLAAGRLNGNVVQAVTNDTNLTGSISSQNLTLGWQNQLAVARGGTGAATLTQYNLLVGNGSNAVATITPGTVFQVLRSAGASAYPLYSDIGSLLTAGSNINITGTSSIAVSGAPSFATSVTSPTYTASGALAIKPGADSTTAIQLQTSGGTSVLDVDTTNQRVGVGTTGPNARLDLGIQVPGLNTPAHYLLAAGANNDWQTDLATIYDSNYVDQYLVFNGKLTGGTRLAPTFTSGNVEGSTYIKGDGTGFLQIGSIPAGAGQAPSPGITMLSSGNVGIGTSTPTLGPLTMASGAFVSSGGTWTNASDRNLKENFATISPASILEKIDQLPVTQWDYKSDGPSVNHIGPVAQDFWTAFHLGNSQTSISTIDPAGVALLGIQALDQKIQQLQATLSATSTSYTTPGTNSAPLSVTSPAPFSGDSVGQAKIIQGATSVRVTFSQPYAYQPIITATPLDFVIAAYRIANIDASGFTIQTQAPATIDTTFDWHSFASPSEQLSVSGITQPIPLILPAAPAPAAPPISVSSATAATSAGSGSTATPGTPSASSIPDSTASSTPPAILSTSTTTPPSSIDPGAPATSTPTVVTSQSSSPAPTAPPPALSETSSPAPAAFDATPSAPVAAP